MQALKTVQATSVHRPDTNEKFNGFQIDRTNNLAVKRIQGEGKDSFLLKVPIKNYANLEAQLAIYNQERCALYGKIGSAMKLGKTQDKAGGEQKLQRLHIRHYIQDGQGKTSVAKEYAGKETKAPIQDINRHLEDKIEKLQDPQKLRSAQMKQELFEALNVLVNQRFAKPAERMLNQQNSPADEDARGKLKKDLPPSFNALPLHDKANTGQTTKESKAQEFLRMDTPPKEQLPASQEPQDRRNLLPSADGLEVMLSPDLPMARAARARPLASTKPIAALPTWEQLGAASAVLGNKQTILAEAQKAYKTGSVADFALFLHSLQLEKSTTLKLYRALMLDITGTQEDGKISLNALHIKFMDNPEFAGQAKQNLQKMIGHIESNGKNIEKHNLKQAEEFKKLAVNLSNASLDQMQKNIGPLLQETNKTEFNRRKEAMQKQLTEQLGPTSSSETKKLFSNLNACIGRMEFNDSKLKANAYKQALDIYHQNGLTFNVKLKLLDKDRSAATMRQPLNMKAPAFKIVDGKFEYAHPTGGSSEKHVTADFANAYLGGGAFGHGAVQEEIQVMESPDFAMLLASFPSPLNPMKCALSTRTPAEGADYGQRDRAGKGEPAPILIEGLHRVVKFEGYGFDAFAKPIKEQTSFTPFAIVAAAAPHIRPQDKFSPTVAKDLFKNILAEMTLLKQEGKEWFSSGKLGAGAFNNDPQLVYMLHRLAAEQLGMNLELCFFGKQEQGVFQAKWEKLKVELTKLTPKPTLEQAALYINSQLQKGV